MSKSKPHSKHVKTLRNRKAVLTPPDIRQRVATVLARVRATLGAAARYDRDNGDRFNYNLLQSLKRTATSADHLGQVAHVLAHHSLTAHHDVTGPIANKAVLLAEELAALTADLHHVIAAHNGLRMTPDPVA